MQSLLFGQTKAQEIAIKLHKERDEKLKKAHDIHVKGSDVIAGDVCFWRKPTVADRTMPSKFQLKSHGPYLVLERHPGNCVTLRHLHTGSRLPHRVSIGQLIRPLHYRQIGANQLANEENANAQTTETDIVNEPNVPPFMAPKMSLFLPSEE